MSASSKPSLLATMRRANLRLVIAAVAGAWLGLTFVAYASLRVYVDQNLQLVANSIAYSVQAAAVFRDGASAQETLAQIGAREDLVAADVLDGLGRPLANFRRQPGAGLEAVLASFGELLLPQAAASEIRVEDRQVGRVSIRGNSLVYVRFFGGSLAAVLVCLALVVAVVTRLSRHFEREVVEPLNSLAALTDEVRRRRAFDRRAPAAAVREIHQLGEDFNALLGEIERHEAEQEARARKLESANESLSHRAAHDSLTGLPNRAHFLERLGQALALNAARGIRVGVLYLDNDNFKSVNDRHGHAAGDALLTETGRRIRAVLRVGDVVARIGGDEFAVLLAPLRGVDDASVVAGNIVRAMREPIAVSPQSEVVSSVSVGVAVYPDHAATLDGLLAAADAAMYRAKAEERNAFRVAQSGDESRPGRPHSNAECES